MDADNFPLSEPQKPFTPDQHTNEKFREKLDKLRTRQVHSHDLDPARAAVKTDSDVEKRTESTMMTKFESVPLAALPDEAFPSVGAELKVISQAEYKASEKKHEENTFTNIQFSKTAVPETLEEAEEFFIGKFHDDDTPAQREREHKQQAQKERAEFQKAALQREEAERSKRASAEDIFLFHSASPAAAPVSLEKVLPSPAPLKIVKKRRRPEEESKGSEKDGKEGKASSAGKKPKPGTEGKPAKPQGSSSSSSSSSLVAY
eukprot:RCo050462